jgi:hypothetical protein
MPPTELPVPTTLRALTCPGVGTERLVADMARALPHGGMAAATLPEGRRLATATRRLLDSRILTAAAEILDLDVAKELVACLARLARLREAAARTLADPAEPEVVETLLEPYPLTVTDDLSVELRIDGRAVATIRFHLDVAAALGETSLVVRLGEIEVVCETLTVTATLTLVGWSTPLWKAGPIELPEVSVALRPPVPVPLLPAPRASSEPGPRRIAGRPPVPGVAERPAHA